ncbi:unnamed protein product [Protopolystoma xenopodis]|uniref:Cadherin domain-containing protein n=1 Tax=Protopolystoma xenopodis TaxID=117903 RepID=A0A3S5BR00_9PLAT|nr:unnamed protein product [Protopolystoma xenopodis]
MDAESFATESGGCWLIVQALEVPYGHSGQHFTPLNYSISQLVVSTETAGPLKAIAEVFIQIIDVNDNYPMPLAPEYRYFIPENLPYGHHVAQVLGHDFDSIHYSDEHLTYAIVEGDPDENFEINPRTG